MTTVIPNEIARRLFLSRQGLCDNPGHAQGPDDLLALIERLGFVQIDSIKTVERAHHMILFSRNQTYKKKHLVSLLENKRGLFEHWTHDASIIPMTFFPYWRHRFQRKHDDLLTRWKKWHKDGFENQLDPVHTCVEQSGPLMARDFRKPRDRRVESGGGWWAWHPSKTALEFLWHTGRLSVCRREGFQKVYDLSERVVPAEIYEQKVSSRDFLDWTCSAALDRLAFATSGELAAFWDLVSLAEAKEWCEQQKNTLIEVSIETANGTPPYKVFARPSVLSEIDGLPSAPKRVRILSPFDPVLRDRKRACRLFNFDYRIEVFVPKAKRAYGYYVFPVLQGDTLIGRIDMKCFRDDGDLRVRAFWPEPGVRFGKLRRRELERELERVRWFSGVDRLSFEEGWIRI